MHRSSPLVLFLAGMLAAGARPAAPEAPRMEPQQDPVFVSGRDGYHTFRIPALIPTAAGTLLAFCEGRKAGRGDSGDIDTVMRRSGNGGKSWGPLQLVADDGGNTFGNP